MLGVCLSVYPSVCLSVCLLATSRRNDLSDLHENFTKDVSVDKEELIKFWKLSDLGGSGPSSVLVVVVAAVVIMSTLCKRRQPTITTDHAFMLFFLSSLSYRKLHRLLLSENKCNRLETLRQ